MLVQTCENYTRETVTLQQKSVLRFFSAKFFIYLMFSTMWEGVPENYVDTEKSLCKR